MYCGNSNIYIITFKVLPVEASKLFFIFIISITQESSDVNITQVMLSTCYPDRRLFFSLSIIEFT